MPQKTATLLFHSPDQKGLVAALANFVFHHGGNILDCDQHVELSRDRFLTRLEWQLDGFTLSTESKVREEFSKIAQDFNAEWEIFFSGKRKKVSIWVSKQDHCLYDLLLRQRSGELDCEIGLIISNHKDLERVAKGFSLPFVYLPITAESKKASEQKALELLDKYSIDLVVLAKYMQILSSDFIQKFSNIINIHHSFLPAFKGADPYKQAFTKGVKIIGATSHFVTSDLDEGPIIEQDVIRVSHRDDVDQLKMLGKDLERVVLARAVKLHLENRVLTFDNKTVVFR